MAEKCCVEGCERDARARARCDTHYRQLIRPSVGHVGVEPLDDVIFKIRVRTPTGGSQPFYYSKPQEAMARASRERRKGTLLFFGEYRLDTDHTV